MKVTKDGFVWLQIDKNKIWEVFNLFEVYELHEDESESLISTPQGIQKGIDNNIVFGIEVGHVYKEAFVLYSCDTWHTHDSKVLLGVYTRHALAVKQADEHSKQSEEGELSKDDVLLLGDINGGIKQTQNISENYIIEVEQLNQKL